MLQYTLLQFRLYVERAHRRERRNWRQQIIGNAIVASGGKELQRLLESLDDSQSAER